MTMIPAGLAGIALSLALTGGSMAQEVTLKLHHLLGPKSPAQLNMIEPWVKAVEEDSNGRIKVEIYPAMSLGGTPPQLVRQVRDGVVDIVWTVNGYTPELYPRTEVFELPGVYTGDTTATNLAMRDLYDQYLAPEYEGVKIIVLHVHAGQGIQMRDKLVRKPEDLKGLKMRIPTRTGAWIIESLGATPVGMPIPDLPQALSTGAVDGAFIPWEIIPPFKIQELTKYQIEGPNHERFGTTTFQISMNQAKYDSLPDDLKAVIDENSGHNIAKQIGQVWMDVEGPGHAAALEAGNEFIDWPVADKAEWQAAVQPAIDRWLAEVADAGIDGQALLEAASQAVGAHSSP
jgi:TRAP-type C4-dicarboxylate transport system substrate-binding protein